MSLEESLKHKSVLVTGAGQGIGRAVSQRLHSYGAKVYAVSRSKEPLDSLVQECPNIIPIQLDIGHSWVETQKVISDLKDLDIVINNAGISGLIQSFLDVTEANFDNLFGVNVKALVNVSQTAAKNMITGKRKGTIINISSVTAIRAFENSSIYFTSKVATDMLTKCMALELGKHSIRVNSVNLGMVRTKAFDSIAEDEDTLRKALDPIFSKVVYGQDFLPMEDVVNTILFTASNLACTLTGACIVLDGGYTTA